MSYYYYTVEDVADIMGVHPGTVFKWIKDGDLKHERPLIVKKGEYQGYRITEAMIEDFMINSVKRLGVLAAKAERLEREARIARLDYEAEVRYWNDCFYEKIGRRF